MDVAGAFGIASAVLAALGGGGAIVWALSGHLGRIWATRLMDKQRQEHEKELARLRAELESQNARALDAARASLSLDLTKQMGAHQDKVQLYRSASEIVVDMVVQLGAVQQGMTMPAEQASTVVLEFERKRLRAYAFLGMFAPQRVMDGFDAVIDYLLGVLGGEVSYDFNRVRELGIAMLNEIRVDLGIDSTPIAYRGERS